MKGFAAVLIVGLLLGGCATPQEMWKRVLGVSTQELEELRKDAQVGVLNYGYQACRERAEKILKTLPEASIYAQDKNMIAFYYTCPNTTTVGIFFKEIDASHTQVEISCADRNIKDLLAKKIFFKEAA